MFLSRRLRRTKRLADEPLTAPTFGSPNKANLFYAMCGTLPSIGFRVRGEDGREYQVNLTDADIKAINDARNNTYAGEEYRW